MEKLFDDFYGNIINWYSFNNTNRILQLGINDNVEKLLKKKFKTVLTIEDFEQLDPNIKKFDYILVYGYENYNIKIENLFEVLNEEGKILIIGDNDFSLNNWSKYSDSKDCGIEKLEKTGNNYNSLLKLKKDLLETEYYTNTFYVFPNYKQTELIINESFKIKEEHIGKYNPNINTDEIKLFDEIKVLNNLVEQDQKMLDVFVNSYFIEVSKQKIETEEKYISFNNCRKEDYRLITIIKDDVVEKIPANKHSKKHIDNMKKIIGYINEDGIEILDYFDNGKICSKYIKDKKTLDMILFDMKDNFDKIVEIVDLIKNMFLKNSVSFDNIKDKDAQKNILEIFKDEEKVKKLHFLKNAYWDMVPKNCFYIDNKFVFFDQEWMKNYLPVEFIIYRSIINSYNLVMHINVDDLFEKLNIIEYKDCFEKMDSKIREEIINQDIYHEMYSTNIKKIDSIVYDNKIMINSIEQLKEENINKQKYIEILETEITNLEKQIMKILREGKNDC